MTFTVTQKHINDGVRGNSRLCPIAIAAIAVIPDSRNVSVGPATILVATDFRNRSFYLPIDACKWMRDFDTSTPVHPFSFEAEEY